MTERRNIPTIVKPNGKTGQGDLQAYASRRGVTYAFLPRVMSTSGRIHGEFLRLLYILTHRRPVRWFEQLGAHDPSDGAFKFRHGQYFWHTCAGIGHAAAPAVGRRARVAEHTLR